MTMLLRRLKNGNLQLQPFLHWDHHLARQQWRRVFAHSRSRKDCTFGLLNCSAPGNVYHYHQPLVTGDRRSSIFGGHGRGWYNGFVRFYSSNGDNSSTSGDKQVPVKDTTDFDKEKTLDAKFRTMSENCDKHGQLSEQDQKEWLEIEKLSFEGQRKESPFLTKKERFRNEILRRVVPWENISVSWDTFPYYINEHVKTLLVECAASHLKHRQFTSAYGDRLPSCSGRILLQATPGTELYRERIVRALSRHLKVPLLVLDGGIHISHGFNLGFASESELDDDNEESGEEFSSLSDAEDETCNEADSDGGKSENDEASAKVLNKIVPISIDEFAARVSGELDSENASAASQSDDANSAHQSDRPFRKGDRVKYVGATSKDGDENRPLTSGQRGEIFEINGDQVAVILDQNSNKDEDEEKKLAAEEDGKPSIYWIDVQDLVHDDDMEAQDWYIALQALKEVLPSLEPVIVYLRDPRHWLESVPKTCRKEFIQKLEETFDELPGPILFICGQNKIDSSPKEREKLVVFPQFGRAARLPIPLQRLTEGFRPNKTSKKDIIEKVFSNILRIDLPKEEEMMKTFHKQLEEDKKITTTRVNLVELHKVLLEHDLCCMDLLQVKTDGVVLTRQKAKQVVGWARNHHLSSCTIPCIKNDRLNLPRESLEISIARLRDEEATSKRPLQNLKTIAKDEYESNFISAVVPPGEIGVKFEDIGALDDVKKTMHDLVTLPMRRPELFAHGNLLRPCKGILLFGPPGTGKTLLAKALATEAGANFISITGSTLTSKWFGDAEKLTKALFSFASKLAPVIIFVDEIDSILGARGGAFEHEATRRMRNEFMAAWDGLRSKDSQRILVLGATNRPFDLDDAVIRRLPRRIHVDLPDTENRIKILKIFLAQENLDPSFGYDQLAKETEGYSGSDLKNLCIAAAYKPVQELLEEEKKTAVTGNSLLRPLNLDDFLQAKAKVGASVAYDATSMNELRKWNDRYGEGGSRRRSPFGFGS